MLVALYAAAFLRVNGVGFDDITVRLRPRLVNVLKEWAWKHGSTACTAMSLIFINCISILYQIDATIVDSLYLRASPRPAIAAGSALRYVQPLGTSFFLHLHQKTLEKET